MHIETTLMPADYDHLLTVSTSAIDAHGHANNVQYVQWMQDAAVRHFETAGGGAVLSELNAIWVVRSHQIEYLKPALLRDAIRIRTWVENFRRVTSTRKYEFVRVADQAVLARGQTDWVLIDATTGRPRSIPPQLMKLFEIDG